MLAWEFAGVLLIALAAVLALLQRTRREARQLSQQLVAAQRDLEQAQKGLALERARQAAAGMAVTDALLMLDDEGRVIWANPSAQRLFGSPVDKTLIEATRSYELDALLGDAPRAEQVLVRQVVLGQQTFSARLVRMPSGALLALEDQSELQRLGRARRDFVANISHELRTPLAAIRLLADTLQAGALVDPALASEMLSKINIEIDALSQLARELLDLSLIESGQMPIKLELTHLLDLAQSQVERFMPQAQQKKMALIVDIEPGLCVLADNEMISRALSNLLHNAIKFTPANGQITVSAQVEGENVVVSVADSGPGIPHAELDRIFERFYKIDRARGQSGTGLGLAIARHIVEGHGGRIWAESQVGRGATFRFTLPTC